MGHGIAWIPAVLLLGAAINGAIALCLAHRRTSARVLVSFVGCLAPLAALALAVSAFGEVTRGGEPNVKLWNWMSGAIFSFDVAFRLDHLSGVMILVVTGIGSLIHLYSVGYMSGDPGIARFFSYLNLFMFFMSVLVLGSSLLTLFVGWEGVGLCSYLLIGFWWKDPEKAKAGAKAFIVNRIGDVGFVLGILLLVATMKSDASDFVSMESFVANGGAEALNKPFIGSISVATAACLLLALGAFGKSAQIPLYVWLPDAMAGPTPVSALIHAATMVTAGVYMIARLNFLFVLAPAAMALIAVVGAVTALFAATIGFAQDDIKKVLAYSTVSQLGFMFVAVGVGAFSVGIFHVVTHAFFKALLFLGAGSVIHGLHEEQNMRKMGGLIKVMPITAVTMIVGSLALAGMPPFSGFFSKDEILASVLHPHPAFPDGLGGWLYGVLLVASLCTAFYTFRLVWLTFFGESRLDPEVKAKAHESPFIMTVPLMLLAVGAVLVGFLGVPHALGGQGQFGAFLRQTLVAEVEVDHGTGSGPLFLIGVAVAASVAGIAASYVFYRLKPDFAVRFFRGLGGLGALIARAYRVDDLYSAAIVRPLTKSARGIFYERVDLGIVDRIVNFLGGLTRGVAAILRLFQTGAVRTYVFVMILATVVVVWSVILRN